MNTKISDLPIIFISYDEENADEHYAKLLEQVPWAQRVHGVEGSDSAHKAAAELAGDSDRFVTVDADNIVDDDFFDMMLDFESAHLKGKVLSWASINEINGLHYGNGGLKCWPTQFVKDMKTHENSDNPQAQVDFCWEDEYLQMHNTYCHTFQNASPRMAFRAGFREGCKMTLSNGLRTAPEDFHMIWPGSVKRLGVWMSVGTDVKNGLWSVYGARLGFYKTMLTDWDFINVRDFTYLNYDLWEDEVLPQFEGGESFCESSGVSWDNKKLLAACIGLEEEIKANIKIQFTTLSAEASAFCKYSSMPPKRASSSATEADIARGVV